MNNNDTKILNSLNNSIINVLIEHLTQRLNFPLFFICESCKDEKRKNIYHPFTSNFSFVCEYALCEEHKQEVLQILNDR